MNDTSKLCRQQVMGLICLMGLGMYLCTRPSEDVICPHKRQNPKMFVMTNFWGTDRTIMRWFGALSCQALNDCCFEKAGGRPAVK